MLKSIVVTTPDGKEVRPFAGSATDARLSSEILEVMDQEADSMMQLQEDWRALWEMLYAAVSHTAHAALFVSTTSLEDDWCAKCALLVQEIVSIYSPTSPAFASNALQRLTSMAQSPVKLAGEMRLKAYKISALVRMYDEIFASQSFAHPIRASAVYAQLMHGLAHAESAPWWNSVALKSVPAWSEMTVRDLCLELAKLGKVEDTFRPQASPALTSPTRAPAGGTLAQPTAKKPNTGGAQSLNGKKSTYTDDNRRGTSYKGGDKTKGGGGNGGGNGNSRNRSKDGHHHHSGSEKNARWGCPVCKGQHKLPDCEATKRRRSSGMPSCTILPLISSRGTLAIQ